MRVGCFEVGHGELEDRNGTNRDYVKLRMELCFSASRGSPRESKAVLMHASHEMTSNTVQ